VPQDLPEGGVNQMWILKNSKELLANLKARNFSETNRIKTYDFSTLYTTIPNDRLKSRLLDIIDNCFVNKNAKRKYPYESDQSPETLLC
jgi:hypothetical protein